MIIKFDEEITLRIVRGGICQLDDLDDHYLKLTFPRYDCPTIPNLLRMIDIWLIETHNASWTIAIGHEQIGRIIIHNSVHSYEVLTHLEIWQFDVSKKITCFIDKFFDQPKV